MINWKSSYDRNSHEEFFYHQRDWTSIENYWSFLLQTKSLPSYIQGDTNYGITTLQSFSYENHQTNFPRNDPKEKRKSFAFVIGYNGSKYIGYQQQKGSEIKTVEDDLDIAFGRKVIAAGRTDKDVSAMSQVVSFSTYDELTIDQIVKQIESSEPFQRHRIVLWESARVPRKFHPIFSATWRRYLYLFPVNPGRYGKESIDIDLLFVNECLTQIVDITLPFNGFAHRDDRSSGEGLQDFCFLYRAHATLVTLQASSYNSESQNPVENSRAICIELVGSRFLRRMVRILTATVLRESILPGEQRDIEILKKICLTRSRGHAALALPGTGLALCGVGFSLSGDALQIPMMSSEHSSIADFYANESSRKEVLDDEDGDIVDEERIKDELRGNENQHKRKSENSRRARYQNKKNKLQQQLQQQQQQQESTLSISAATYNQHSSKYRYSSNLSNIDSFLQQFQSNQVHSQLITTIPYQEELINYNQELLYYPQRLFQFSFGEIVLDQSCHQVGTTIWDAEVVLAHFVDHLFVLDTNQSLLEIGAGTGLASIVAYKTSKFHKIIIQDLEEVLLSTFPIIQEKASGNSSSYPSTGLLPISSSSELLPASCAWGKDAVRIIQHKCQVNKISWIVMADVLYHAEDFQPLLETVFGLLENNGNLIISFEQRRKDVSDLLTLILSKFQNCEIFQYQIPDQHNHEIICEINICWFKAYLLP